MTHVTTRTHRELAARAMYPSLSTSSPMSGSYGPVGRVAQAIADAEARGAHDSGKPLEQLLGLVSEEDGTVVFRVLADGSRHCQARLVAGRGDDAARAAADCLEKQR